MKKNSLIDLSAEEQYAAIEESIVQRLMTSYGLNRGIISRTSRFKDDFGLDSLDFVELVMHIEKETGLHVADEDIDHDHDTVDSLVKTFIKNIK